MKTFFLATALAGIVVSSSFALASAHSLGNAVIVRGHVVGHDPDPNVRLSILREFERRGSI